jgi:NADP-dependent 3-hydroxy acid dehydrogenase YdfG
MNWREIPGNWDRARMIKPEDIAEAVVSIHKQPKETMTEEIVLMPSIVVILFKLKEG